MGHAIHLPAIDDRDDGVRETGAIHPGCSKGDRLGLPSLQKSWMFPHLRIPATERSVPEPIFALD